jgi:hypothetical protein
MELMICWRIPCLRLAERGVASWQDGDRRSKWRKQGSPNQAGCYSPDEFGFSGTIEGAGTGVIVALAERWPEDDCGMPDMRSQWGVPPTTFDWHYFPAQN